MSITQIRDFQINSKRLDSLEEAVAGGGGGDVTSAQLLEVKRELAHLKAVTELKDRVDGASGLFYDLFDRTNKGSVAQLDTWEKEVDALTAGQTSITVAEPNGPRIEAGMEITIQSNSDPDILERVTVDSIVPEEDGSTYTINLKEPLVNDYPDGALLYRSKGDAVIDRFIFAAKRGEFGAKTYTPDVLPTSTCYDAAFSPDGKYLAVATYDSPRIIIYKRTGDIFTKLPNPDILPPNSAYSVAFSPDNSYLVVGHDRSPYITIYKRNGDNFTKLPNPASLPGSIGNGVAFSPDGNLLAVAHSGSPYVTIYKRNDDTFTKLPNPDILPTSTGNSVAFSPDGNYLAVAHLHPPYITIYKFIDGIFKKLPNPDVLPTNTGRGVTFSPDGNYMVVAHTGQPCITIYKRDGDTFTKLPDPDILPTSGNTAYGAAFSPDGKYLVIAHEGSRYITIYKHDLDFFVKQPNPSILPAGTGQGVSFSPRGDFLAVAHTNSPYITIYNTGFTLTPMKHIDVRYNITSLKPISTLVAWVERERNPVIALDCAVSIHDSEETYLPPAVKTVPIDDTHDELQITISTDTPANKATLRLTATKEDPEAMAVIRKITGAVG